ncbi:MAG: amidohydrolase [Nitriliruptoraceae bacterium]|nr:amidohydrolase [Nitriliruptoraceae bacterium]
MVTAPGSDDEVPAFWRALDRPGLVDVHTHFMPEPVLRKVWAYFDAVTDDDGRPGWPITYRTDEATRLATLRALGVRGFTSLFYPHKPGMAGWLNDWGTGFAAAHDDVVHSATFFPEPDADRQVAEALEAGARIFKVHLQVGAYDPRDPLLSPVWDRLARSGTPVVVHAGSGPEPGPFTGDAPFAQVLARHPQLRAVIAHLGAPEYEAFLDLAARYEHVHLDTTMAFTPFLEALAPFPDHLRARLVEQGDRIVLGTDFPNIPYPYAQQLASLVELDLGDEWLRGVCVDNGARLLGLDPVTLRP